MKIGVLKEPLPETRVSLLPEHVSILQKWNVDILVESNAGENAFACRLKIFRRRCKNCFEKRSLKSF